MLIQMAHAVGQDDLATEFQTALDQEHEHLEKVRGWIKALASIELATAA
jgi:hypothetical protein